MRIIALILGILGGIVGLASAISAFLAVGNDAAYNARLWTGWLALALAVFAAIAALFIRQRPVFASIVMLISGVVGFLCINLFYINTFYFISLPLWLIAAAIGFISARME
jgi:hypothetical protein